MANVSELTDQTFAQAVGATADKPLLVDFWAEWCGPCRMVDPIVKEIASEYPNQVSVAKVNVDQHPQIAAQFGIMGIPTLILFKGGERVEQITGAMGKAQLLAKLQRHFPENGLS